MSGSLFGVSVIIPERNESHKVLDSLRVGLKEREAEVIIVDDGSDNSYPESIKHGVSFGYGASILTGIKNASNEIIVTMDGDGQHQVQDVLNLYQVWQMIEADMIIGKRRIKNEIWYRYLGRKFLNWTASFICLYWLNDLNSGFRIFKKGIAFGYRDILCQSFSFTTCLTLSMICDRYRVEFFPIDVIHRKEGKSKVNVFKDGWITLFYILKLGFALRTRGLRSVLRNLRCPKANLPPKN